MIYVYIVKCKDASYYTGVTNHLERRLFEHHSDQFPQSYTHQRRPVQLVYSESSQSPLEVIAREKQIKGWNRDKKEALIAQQYELLPQLSRAQSSHPSTGLG